MSDSTADPSGLSHLSTTRLEKIILESLKEHTDTPTVIAYNRLYLFNHYNIDLTTSLYKATE